MIPRILHYVWVGPAPIPLSDRDHIAHWRTLMPDWDFRFWNNANIDYSSTFVRQAYATRGWSRVADYVRMQVIEREGGVYLDTDVGIRKPFDPLLDAEAFFGFQVGNDRPFELVNNAVFGAVPGHWLPQAYLRHVDSNLDGRIDTGPLTGPILVTQLLRDKGLRHASDQIVEIAGVTLHPRRVFYPYSWLEEYTPDCVTVDTYAVHFWSQSWGVNSRSVWAKVRRRLIRCAALISTPLMFNATRRWVARKSRRRVT